MLKKVVLENFKCFPQKTNFHLAPITIMYGRNGCGKSTLSQSLLLLAQTMKDSNDVENLQLTGRYVALGTYDDVVNSFGDRESFEITLQSGEDDIVKMKFGKHSDRPQMARIVAFEENGESRFEEYVGKSVNGGMGTKLLGSTSDVKPLQTLKSIRYVSAGRLGPQNSIVRNDSLADDELGVDGENLIQVLSRQGKTFIEEVRKALSDILGGATIDVSTKDVERIDLYLNSKDKGELYHPVNVGFGYSYVLPVIVASFLAERGGILIVENPEAHLHPAAQSRIMEFLIRIAQKKNLQLIIETHSDHVVNGMRIAIKEKTIRPRDAHILYFSDGTKPVKLITSDERGTLTDYPDDFLDEWTSQLLKLI